YRFNFNSLGRFLLHGKISSICNLLMLLKAYSKYLSIHKPFAFAVWIIENSSPEAWAPFSVLENKKFFLAITKGFTDLSAILFDISKYPYSLYVNNSSHEFFA
ncbi:hypothetical protein EI71_01530, partial [Anaeroplasma bactoclasticum]